MDHDELVATFSQTVGVEKAESLITAAATAVGIGSTDSYTHLEVADICETIQDENDGYVRLVANEVRIRQQAQQRFDALLDEITDPVVTVSFDESEPLVTAVNPAFEQTFGYGTDAVGHSLTELIVPKAQRQDALNRWLRTDSGSDAEVERVTAAGDHRTFLFRPVVVSRDSGSIEGYGIYTDITERKRRERRLELQNEQLERFASVVSHDLRNPLQVASGYVGAALAETENESVEQHLESIQQANQRMAGLIDDLLTLARDGQVVEETEPVTLGEVVWAAWRSVDAPGATLDVLDCDQTIMADQSRLRQLFENLLRNAVEHGSASAQPSLAHGDGSEASPGPAEDEPSVEIRVGVLEDGFYLEDDGPGIPHDQREEVFDHGYTTQSSGTGFGLAIVQAIAEAHEWEIAVVEGTTGGARFEITGLTTA